MNCIAAVVERGQSADFRRERFGFGRGCGGLRPNRNLVTPPELARDWPVAFFAKPIEVALGIALGRDFDPAIADCFHR